MYVLLLPPSLLVQKKVVLLSRIAFAQSFTQEEGFPSSTLVSALLPVASLIISSISLLGAEEGFGVFEVDNDFKYSYYEVHMISLNQSRASCKTPIMLNNLLFYTRNLVIL